MENTDTENNQHVSGFRDAYGDYIDKPYDPRFGTIRKIAWYRRWWGITLIALLSLLLALLGTFTWYVARIVIEAKNNPTSLQLNNPTIDQREWGVVKDAEQDYGLGSTSSPLTIVEFADYACPYCKESNQYVREALSRYPDRIRYIYRDFPLHENSVDLSLAARCAGEQGKYWNMHDQLFALQDNITGTGTVAELAFRMNMNVPAFSKCLDDRKYETAITKDFTDADYLNLQGTPTWYFNGIKVEGFIPRDTFFKIINSLITN